MASALTNEVIAALLVRGVSPLVDITEAPDADDVLRFLGSDAFLTVGDREVSWYERRETGGDALLVSWGVNRGNVTQSVAGIVQHFWELCGAKLKGNDMSNPARLTQLENTLRLIATCTTDSLAKAIALDALDEQPEQSRDGLLRTCWCDNTTASLRDAVAQNLRYSGNTAVAELVCEQGKT